MNIHTYDNSKVKFHAVKIKMFKKNLARIGDVLVKLMSTTKCVMFLLCCISTLEFITINIDKKDMKWYNFTIHNPQFILNKQTLGHDNYSKFW